MPFCLFIFKTSHDQAPFLNQFAIDKIMSHPIILGLLKDMIHKIQFLISESINLLISYDGVDSYCR